MLQLEIDSFSVSSLKEWLADNPVEAAQQRRMDDHLHHSTDRRTASVGYRFQRYEIDPAELVLGQKLAAGASGQVMKGSYHGAAVAVKEVFSLMFQGDEQDLQDSLSDFSKEVSRLEHCFAKLSEGDAGRFRCCRSYRILTSLRSMVSASNGKVT